MSKHELRARALLDALVAESSPAQARSEASLAMIEARLIAEDARASHRAPARARRPELLRSAAIAIAIAASLLLVIGALASTVRVLLGEAAPPRDAASDLQRDETQSQPSTTGLSATAAAPPPASLPAAAPLLPAPTAASITVEAAPPRADAASSSAARSEAPPRALAPDLAAEVALIRRAKSESDATAALAWLDRHAHEFPAGELARERQMLRAERLCDLGRLAQLRTIVDDFLADGRDDPLARRMQRVCDGR